jgi:hypothetical protein
MVLIKSVLVSFTLCNRFVQVYQAGMREDFDAELVKKKKYRGAEVA